MPTNMHLDGDEVKDLIKAKVGSVVSFVVHGKLESLTIPHKNPKKTAKQRNREIADFQEEPSARIYISSIEGMKVGKSKPARDMNTKDDIEKAIENVKGAS